MVKSAENAELLQSKNIAVSPLFPLPKRGKAVMFLDCKSSVFSALLRESDRGSYFTDPTDLQYQVIESSA